MNGKRSVLFVGAGGQVAGRLLPGLAERYDIVGIAGRRAHLSPYCRRFIQGELTSESARLFDEALADGPFDAIIWNAVRYHLSPMMESTRGSLHLEFDLAIALPLECLRTALARGFSGRFILVSSGFAFGFGPVHGSYSIVKRGQVILAEYLSRELAGRLEGAAAIAVRILSETPDAVLLEAFTDAIEGSVPKPFYEMGGARWDAS